MNDEYVYEDTEEGDFREMDDGAQVNIIVT